MKTITVAIAVLFASCDLHAQQGGGLLENEVRADAGPSNAVRHQPWVTPPVRAPGVDFRTFESRAANARVSFHIYLPEAYHREQERRFPVLYWLHGSGGGLRGIPQLARHFDSAIAAGKTPPCLVVFVNGLVEGMYVDWKDASTPLETVIVKDLVPHVDATWRTIAAREGRMLDGFSMGGYGAARLGFKYPDVFRAVSIVGAGPMQPELVQTPRAGRQRAAEVLQRVYGGDQAYFRSVNPRTLAEQNAEAIAKGSLVRIVIGDQDETFENNRAFHEHLERLKIPHRWTVLRGVAHDPISVLSALGDDNWAFYRMAFAALDAHALWVSAAGGHRLSGGNEVAVDGADNVLVVANAHGGFTAGGTTLRHRGGMDAYVLKYTPDGKLGWVRSIAGPQNEQGRGIAGDARGNVIVVGEFTGTLNLGGSTLTADSEQRDVSAVKYDPNGQQRWALRFGSVAADYARGVGCEIEVDEAGNPVIAGQFHGAIQIGSHRLTATGSSDMFVAKFNAEGRDVWARHLPTEGHAANFALASHHDDRVTLVGTYSNRFKLEPFELVAPAGGGAFVATLQSESEYPER